MIQDCEYRYTNDPADKPPYCAEKHNCENNPETGKSGRVTQNLRPEDISVKLLQNDDENQQKQRLQRIDHKYKDAAKEGAEVRSEERNNIGNADDKRYQHREWRTDHLGTDKT